MRGNASRLMWSGLVLLFAWTTGCAPEDDPCRSGPTLEARRGPSSLAVDTEAGRLGVVTVDAAGGSTFAVATDAPTETARAFEALLREVTAGDEVSYHWSKETRDGRSFMCSRAVRRGDPTYAAALAFRLHGRQVGDQHLRVTRRASPTPAAEP